MPLQGATRARCEARARMMKALAHPTRLFMVEVLSEGERCVCELRDLVGADISTVSKHLALLREAGVVARDKRGLQVFYRLRAPCVQRVFDCIGRVEEAVTSARRARCTR
jgi:ArsR family transcriptional regulator